jgi:hypothetical protein
MTVKGVTDHEVMGLDAIDVLHRRVVHPQLHQHHRREEGEDHGRSQCGGEALVPRQALVLRVEVEAYLPLDQRIDEQSHHREHRECGNPLRFLEPYRRDGRQILDPSKARFHGTMLVMIGTQNLGIGTHRTPNRGRQHGLALLCLRPLPCLRLYDHPVALLHLRGALSPGGPGPAVFAVG